MNNDTSEVIRRFNLAFQQHEPALLLDIIADDCVLENTGPAPNGARYEGRAACLAFWQGIASDPGMRFTIEEIRTIGDHSLIFWRLASGEGDAPSLRGVNIMRVRAGLIVEGRGYVKAGM
jgi:hypothetical protein